MMLSAAFCAVPAASRVEPSTASGPMSKTAATSARLASGEPDAADDRDNVGAHAFRAPRAGDGEGGRAACRYGDHDIVRSQRKRVDRRDRGLFVVLAGAVDDKAFAVGGDETDAFLAEAERARKLEPVLHREQARGAGAEIDQPSAGPQRFGDALRRRFERSRLGSDALDGAPLTRDQRGEQRLAAPPQAFCGLAPVRRQSISPTAGAIPVEALLCFIMGQVYTTCLAVSARSGTEMEERRASRAERIPLFESVGETLKREIASGRFSAATFCRASANCRRCWTCRARR